MHEAVLERQVALRNSLPARLKEHLFLLNASGSLLWPARKTLLVSDLHFEKGSYLAQQGNLIPGYDSIATLDRLADDIAMFQPETVICLGDSFHDMSAWTRMDERDRTRLVTIVKQVERWIWITGNHDPDMPNALPGDVSTEFLSDNIVFTHEPLQSYDADAQIFGHFHPKASIRVARHSVSGRCFVLTNDLLIMPAFGAFTGGLDINDTAFSQWVGPQQRRLFIINQNKIYAI